MTGLIPGAVAGRFAMNAGLVNTVQVRPLVE
jgi:hypothetical protein